MSTSILTMSSSATMYNMCLFNYKLTTYKFILQGLYKVMLSSRLSLVTDFSEISSHKFNDMMLFSSVHLTSLWDLVDRLDVHE